MSNKDSESQKRASENVDRRSNPEKKKDLLRSALERCRAVATLA
jgi:hypothetical protein